MTWDDALSVALMRLRSEEERACVERSIKSLRTHFQDCTASDEVMLVGLIRAMLDSPHPAGAISLLERFFGEVQSISDFCRRLRDVPQSVSVLVAVFGYSEFLSNVLIRHPHLLWWLVEPAQLNKGYSREEIRQSALEVSAKADTTERCQEALCRWKYEQLLRIGVRDVLRLANVEEVTRELSDVAHVCIEIASDQAWQELVARYGVPTSETSFGGTRESGMCVLGMGKLGGRELNFCSDIDLVFIYDDEGDTTGKTPDGQTARRITNHEFFNKMGERIVKFLSARGPYGQLFRVDMRLRPEGKSGPLARSLESFINYLEQQAREWERVAYLKARVLTGPAPLRARLYQVIQRFVFDKADPARLTSEIEKLKLMIDREVLLSDTYYREVKRGYGGIREIEFIIAAMQIIYGQLHEALRVRNIFLAIDRLADVNILSRDEADFYHRAYAFLRCVEHRLQMASEHQTHTLPSSPAELEVLARRCHYSSLEEFQQTYKTLTDGVHQRFKDFFQRDIEREAQELQDVLVLLDDDATPDEALPVLARYGIGSERSWRLIRDLAFGTREVFITAQGQQYFEQMLPSLLRMIAQAPLPDRVLPNLHSFMLAVGGITYYYELISFHPEVLRLLVMLFGTSDDFSQVFCSHPEFFDTILGTRLLHDTSDMTKVAERMLEAIGERGAWEHRLVALRRATKFEQLIVALRYITGLADLGEVLQQLSIVADVALRFAYVLAWERFVEKLGIGHAPPIQTLVLGEENYTDCPVTIVAFGKYGGRELNFFGDLDIAYVWDDRPNSPSRCFVQSHERALQFVDQFVYCVTENLREGRLYVLDARLRPHGRNAPLVTPFSHYLNYMAKVADVWELLAFTRARCVAGDSEIITRLTEAALTRQQGFSQEETRQKVVEMRARLAHSVSPADRERIEFKRSEGGLADIEFLLQYWLVCGAIPKTATSHASYFRLFAELEEGLPCSLSQWGTMKDAYYFLRKVETAVRLISREKVARLSTDEAINRGIARFMGISSADELNNRLQQVMRAVRATFLQLMEG
ncbi:MAG: bifunctional [glutamate--ammonia ligase]-adenylyl-L-tyrosine phosphorylase/[glutamate--ammonia-ligase] adenylyltransferase [Candidatus Sumerlaeaceae bacterium]|nr:bifunctional [glutamate--ammonia ligase]-adenylyl-L-tyrosine phosphorylase/[glutamate--ammonia-ligase] adenylyltransferase [Candidatus Sumerlaeaceae bacterium]